MKARWSKVKEGEGVRNLIVGALLGAVLAFAFTRKEVLRPQRTECWPLIIGTEEYVVCLHDGKLQAGKY
jgi:hypothetical protein